MYADTKALPKHQQQNPVYLNFNRLHRTAHPVIIRLKTTKTKRRNFSNRRIQCRMYFKGKPSSLRCSNLKNKMIYDRINFEIKFDFSKEISCRNKIYQFRGMIWMVGWISSSFAWELANLLGWSLVVFFSCLKIP